MGKNERGRSWERCIEETLSLARTRDSKLMIERMTPPMKVIGREEGKKVVRAHFLARGQSDFEGWYRGLHVCIECKDHSADEWFYFSQITKDQLIRLETCHEANGLSFVALRLRSSDPQRDLMACLTMNGIRSLRLSSLAANGSEKLRADNLLEFLASQAPSSCVKLEYGAQRPSGIVTVKGLIPFLYQQWVRQVQVIAKGVKP